ncbi:zinc-dependent alcohol dehydrogenase [Tsukamurella ocularis]|uniref:zinc-dependent alcohol dehydrogenase n=1 Tax=Tsukamurella ocularis TaxID=1970234 RepID=UPI0021670883|nr:alcohol dehydrogenase catalytic domain-containing protein [Tsukamurella ocularis]MCS3780019.1 2-desacetyl-2-hydroxyethyl bacteriochlorophyllide A dehydrogenase [Tsukamurella ocularis]MCS3788581.1 2-desacetyl-2-hydroxyethyl bacteriochlorophyllide A dehydrogenase [Tsukamurella ocularis]MCS3849791.1 2-desacetyl-2-hydroxyethyl bacteriochlorophyllide A dehydrogenase [Tsukamurella ocularis]
MRAITLTAPHTVTLAEVPPPSAGPGEVVVRVALLGLCGTDLGFFDGSSNYLRDGLKAYPFVPGHEWVGRVTEVGAGVPDDLLGTRVAGHNFRPCGRCAECSRGRIKYCPERSEIGVLGPHQGAGAEWIAVPVETLRRIPDSMSDAAATLLEPTSAGMHAVVRLAIGATDRVAVLGAGTLGLAAAQIVRSRGADLVLFDPNPVARALAAELGIIAIDVPREADPGAFDAVIEASGSEAAARAAVDLVAPGGRVAQLGTPHHDVNGYPAATLVIQDATLHGVLSGVGYWDPLIELVESGVVDLDSLVDTVYPLAAVDRAFAHLASGARARPKVLLSLGPETTGPAPGA